MQKRDRTRRTRDQWMADFGLALATLGALCGLISRMAGLW